MPLSGIMGAVGILLHNSEVQQFQVTETHSLLKTFMKIQGSFLCNSVNTEVIMKHATVVAVKGLLRYFIYKSDHYPEISSFLSHENGCGTLNFRVELSLTL